MQYYKTKGFFYAINKGETYLLERFFKSIIKRKKIVIITFACLAALCGVLMLGVGQNYDMSKYLPDDSESKAGIDVLKKEFNYNGMALLMLEDKSIAQVLDIKAQIDEVEGVKNVIWLDDIADIKQPVEFIDEDIKSNYLNGNDALIHIVFEDDDYAETTRLAIDEIKSKLGEDALLSGNAVDSYILVKSVSGNIMTGILIALAIVLLILILTTHSFIEVVLFLITIGVSILLNMGTNVIFGEISYMTFACAAVLQMAISMDYSIFLLHRFEHERTMESDPAKAMAKAAKASFSSVISSGMTTIVGFVALIFMSYTIGADMGLVLAKGIVLSLVCVMLLMPPLAVVFSKAIDRTRHRRLLPTMKNLQHALSGKARYIVLALLAAVSVICYLAQDNNTILYSTSNIGDPKQSAINEKIEDGFGKCSDFVVIVPNGSVTQEYGMAEELKGLSYVANVQGLYAFVDPEIPGQIVPDDIKEEFISENYSRYIVSVNAGIETEEAFSAVTGIRQIASKWFEESYVTGTSPVVFDIRNAASGDFSLIAILSIVFVGIILLLTFRSLSIPLILMFIIETSIWINMSIPYFTGTPMIFIGYMVISAIQLGATIDYAILMTNYYLEGRKTMDKRAASEYAVEKAGVSILMSALVLSAAGFVVSATFTQQAMSQLGSLIGRGAILSGVLTIFVLPQVLTLLDKVISKTTLKRSLKRRIKNET